ncbi:MAG: hypothetical protein GEV09_28530 [Pseudonocardiaceae bacterium]|nr:hypothetical protein [Pseudonocardiaceae bacterium]
MCVIQHTLGGGSAIFQHRKMSGGEWSFQGNIEGTPTFAAAGANGTYALDPGVSWDYTNSQDWRSDVCPSPNAGNAIIWQGSNKIFEVVLADITQGGSKTPTLRYLDNAGAGDPPGTTAATSSRIAYLAEYGAFLCVASHGTGVSATVGVWIYKL